MFAVFGDVHGRADVLASLLETLRYEFGNIPIYSVGDLIDRGPDSAGVLDLCIKEGVLAVLGNHETWLHRYLAFNEFEPFALHRIMGGKETLKSYGLDTESISEIESSLEEKIPTSHKKFILDLPMFRRIEDGGKIYYLTHAGMKDIDPLLLSSHLNAESDEELFEQMSKVSTSFLWVGINRDKPNLYIPKDGGIQLFGHTPFPEVQVHPKWVALDTGCGTRPPNNLSAMVFPSRKIIRANTLSVKIMPNGFTDFSM